jgi:hypothetical protein
VKKLPHFHPLLIAVAPILSLAAYNVDQVRFDQVLYPVLIILLATVVVYGLLWIFSRDLLRSAVTVSLALVVFHTYGRFFERLWRGRIVDDFVAGHLLATALMVVLGVSLLVVIWQTRRNLLPLASFLTTMSATMVLFSVVTLIRAESGWGLSNQREIKVEVASAVGNKHVVLGPVLEDRADLPDIYYIILDGYLRADKLNEVYGFHNSDFINFLRSRGFYVADKSHSNYAQTFLSFASSLNMRYLSDEIQDLLERNGETIKHRKPLYDLIQRPQVAEILKTKGYRYVTVLTHWSGTEKSKSADVAFSFAPILGGEFYNVLLRTTALCALVPTVADRHLFTLSTMEKIPAMRGPTFAFIHLLLPHPPYVFDRHGNRRINIPLSLRWKETTGGWRNKKGYIEQMIFLNNRMKKVISHIIKTSPVDPVIIVQADHGSDRSKYDKPRGHMALVEERLAILNAFYVSSAMKSRLYPEITPVNTFPILFNCYFGYAIDPLPDRMYFSKYKKPYDNEDVTEHLLKELR